MKPLSPADHALAAGLAALVERQNGDGHWCFELEADVTYTAVGFPRVFHLRYHGYPLIFPIWALARWRALLHGNSATAPWGI